MGLLDWLLSPTHSIRYYIMHKVKGHWQALYTGRVDPRKEFFNYKGRTYHIDVSKIQEDEQGHKFLEYSLDFFVPLSVVPGVKEMKHIVEPELELVSSVDSFMTLNRGIVKSVLGSISASSGLSMMLILMLALGITGGYFTGNSLPVCSFNHSCPGQQLYYSTQTYYSAGGTLFSTFQVQAPQGGYVTVTTASPYTVPIYEPTTVTVAVTETGVTGYETTTTTTTTTETNLAASMTSTTSSTSTSITGTCTSNFGFSYDARPINLSLGHGYNSTSIMITPSDYSTQIVIGWSLSPSNPNVIISMQSPVTAGVPFTIFLQAPATATPGTYTLTVTGTNDGCSNSFQLTVIVGA